jgi:hypothetical protein
VEPVLTDFGLVRLLDSTMHTTAGSVSGTPTYMSPEQARGEKVDKRTDIYSLGIMLYEMLAGTVPFQADTTFGMLMKHISEPPPPIKGISKDLEALLDRALAKDPSLRYDSAGDLANEFMAVFNGQTISPGTLHIAELARKAAEASQQSKTQPAQDIRRNRLRVGIEIALVAGLALLIFQFLRSGPNNATATPVPTLDVNIPVGRVRFDDFSFYMDDAVITLNDVPVPGEGKHLEAWFRGKNGETDIVRDMGKVEQVSAGSWRLEETDPDQKNFLLDFDEVLITLEDDGASVTEPSSEIVYSSVFPPKTLVHVRHLVVAFDGVPDNQPLMQSLWYYGASYIARAVNGDALDENYKVGMMQAYKDGDEATVRKRNEEVINLIVGAESDLYLDRDGDGKSTDSGDGFGSLPNGGRLGYLRETALTAKAAADALDSTFSIRSANENLQVCVQNLDRWTNRLLELALQLDETPFGPDMEPIIDEMSSLGKILVRGADQDNDGKIELIVGECGGDDAYKSAYAMADMLIYPGADRVPLPGK